MLEPLLEGAWGRGVLARQGWESVRLCRTDFQPLRRARQAFAPGVRRRATGTHSTRHAPCAMQPVLPTPRRVTLMQETFMESIPAAANPAIAQAIDAITQRTHVLAEQLQLQLARVSSALRTVSNGPDSRELASISLLLREAHSLVYG